MSLSLKKIQFTLRSTRNSLIEFLGGEVVTVIPKLIEEHFRRPFLIIDEAICQLYPDLITKIKAPIFYLKGGEGAKTFSKVERIVNFLQENSCRRHDSVLVIGGGCLGDVAGFVASIYKRGVEWGFFPTTLLSQIDSSIGAKVAINTLQGKNQLGSFWPPKQVYICPAFLKTLEPRQYNAGMAEVIKIAPFAKGNLLTLLQQGPSIEILPLIELAVQTKLDIIGDDWHETAGGTRAALNFGHTIGHGLEKSVSDLLHGEAVALGMLVELHLAKNLGEKVFDANIIEKQLHKFGLPTNYCQIFSKICWQKFLDILSRDKKNIDDGFSFVVPGVDRTIKRFSLNADQMKRILF